MQDVIEQTPKLKITKMAYVKEAWNQGKGNK